MSPLRFSGPHKCSMCFRDVLSLAGDDWWNWIIWVFPISCLALNMKDYAQMLWSVQFMDGLWIFILCVSPRMKIYMAPLSSTHNYFLLRPTLENVFSCKEINFEILQTTKGVWDICMHCWYQFWWNSAGNG